MDFMDLDLMYQVPIVVAGIIGAGLFAFMASALVMEVLTKVIGFALCLFYFVVYGPIELLYLCGRRFRGRWRQLKATFDKEEYLTFEQIWVDEHYNTRWFK